MSNLNNNTAQLEALLAKVNALPEAGGSDPVLQDKTVTPTTSTQTITADNGYDGLDTVTVNAMPIATQATPTVTINSSTGLITATATQTAGYVAAGTKSATSQLAFKAATTITPGTTNQTAVAANTYVGGAITVKGDANLVASNIVSGKSIFGVVGTYTGGGSGGDTSMEDRIINRTLSGTYRNNSVTSIGQYAFYNCLSLTSVSFPACTHISRYAFFSCIRLTSVSFPKVITISNYAFEYCSKLTSVSFPACTRISTNAFFRCSSLASIYLGASTVCTLANSLVFSGTAIWSNKGSIFVPGSLVGSYRAATNWIFFAARIFSYDFT